MNKIVPRGILWCFSMMMVAWLSNGAVAQNAADAPLTLSNEVVEKIAAQVAKDAAADLLNKIKKEQEKIAVERAQAAAAGRQPDAVEQSLLHRNRLFSIGTGVVGGNYFVLGEMIGGVISHPRGSLPCDQGGTCGVEDLQTLNITSAGSIANVKAIKDAGIHSGLAQSNVAYGAYKGTGLFEKEDKMDNLRAIASLYAESVHIVVNKSAGISSVSDLKGKRVSVGARDSGTILQATLVLSASGLSENDFEAEHLNNQESIEKLKEGELDAMFFSVGAPAPALSQLFSDESDFTLLSIDRGAQKEIFKKGAYFSPFTIQTGTYPNVGEVSTISVYALWLTSTEQSPDLIYQMTKALWSQQSQQLFNGSDIGKQISLDNSLKGIGIPLHDGAKKYYDEIGKRF